MCRGRRHVAHREVCGAHIVMRNPRREDCDEDEDDNDNEPDDRETVHDELIATEAQRSGEKTDINKSSDFVPVCIVLLRDSVSQWQFYETRILGSSHLYSMSVRVFAIMYVVLIASTHPCTIR